MFKKTKKRLCDYYSHSLFSYVIRAYLVAGLNVENRVRTSLPVFLIP